MERIPVIWNPTAGGGRLARRRPAIEAAATRLGVELDWWDTEGPGHGIELARRAADEDRPMVVAFGGDGTYNEVARGLLGHETALGVLVGGTTSVLAYELELPRDPVAGLEALIAGVDRVARVGRICDGGIFLLMISAGPDAAVMSSLPGAFKRIGHLGIGAWTLLRSVIDEMPAIQIEAEGRRLEANWVIVGKAASYAGPQRATPGASLWDDELEVVTWSGRSKIAAGRFYAAMGSGEHLAQPGVERFRCRSVSLRSAAQVTWQFDGDPAQLLPIELGVDPEALHIRAPAS